jgi:peptidoglycan hydrolase CwlO-like protein
MADIERRVSSLEEHMAHVVATLDTLATNQNHLDETMTILAESHIKLSDAQIRTQRQFEDTDRRIASLTSAIGELIQQMKSRTN